MRLRRWAFVCLAACGQGSATQVPPDARGHAAVDARAIDAAARDGQAPPLWVDFSAEGCASFDPVLPACHGTAPLALRFVAASQTPVENYLWTFGDGTPAATAASPTHAFGAPGSYDVSLTIGSASGTTERTRPGYVIVAGAPLGGACQTNAQCDAALTCELGFCTRGCAATACDASAVCADLGVSPGGDDWRRPLCLVACGGDGDCPAALRCRELVGEGVGWVKGCFADVLADDGASCRAADGSLDDGACVSGSCIDLGARGLCAYGCGGKSCPSYAACATLRSGESRCLATCGACAQDPWLACEPPGGPGDLGFDAPSGTYCAPKVCTGASDCPGGVCDAGYCRANR